MIKTNKIFLNTKRLREAAFYIVFAGIIAGCAVTPKKLFIKDISRAFEEGTIISATTRAPVSFDVLLTDLSSARIVFVGEKHTDPVHHEIQLKVIKELYKTNPDLAVGMEMFDYTYQGVLDQWSDGKLDQKEFLEKTHWYANWRFDFALYKDILDFIKEKKIKLVGLNIPSYIPSRIRVGGIKNLSIKDKKHLPEKIDTSNTAHRNYVESVYKLHHHKIRKNFDYFYEAQCVWEEIMAQANDPCGRKLDFLAQEMLREANTIAAKANDAEIVQATVEMKTSVDRIKEQVQNVE